MSEPTRKAKVKFKGPGQWRTQADKAQKDKRPPDAALNPPPEKPGNK